MISVPSLSYGMSDVTIMVPHDIVRALRLPPDAIQAAGACPWRSTRATFFRRGRHVLLQG